MTQSVSRCILKCDILFIMNEILRTYLWCLVCIVYADGVCERYKPCSHYCTNTKAGYVCRCPSPLVLAGDNKNCVRKYLHLCG